MLIVNEHHLRRVLTEYLPHHNTARPHRFLGQLKPAQAGSQPPEPINVADDRIRRKQVLGGLTCEYYIAALPPALLRKTQVTTRIIFPSPTGLLSCGWPTRTGPRRRKCPRSWLGRLDAQDWRM